MSASQESFGKRLKKTREEMGFTLKALEARAGISATHISEIERGKTSPTIGALARVADALDKDVAFFFESEELGDVSLVAVEDRVRVALDDGKASSQSLTTAVAGGRLQSARLTLPPGSRWHIEPHQHHGYETFVVVAGRLRMHLGEEVIDLERGDSVHFDASIAHNCENTSPEEAVAIWFASERDLT